MPYTDREIVKMYEEVEDALAALKKSKAPDAGAQRDKLNDRKRMIEREWREIVARKRRGEITDTYSIDLVKEIATPHIKLADMGLTIADQDILPRDGSYISNSHALAVYLPPEPELPLDEDGTEEAETDDDEGDDGAEMSEADWKAEIKRGYDEWIAKDPTVRKLAKLAIGITMEIFERDRRVLRRVDDPSHFNEALEVSEYFTIKRFLWDRPVGEPIFITAIVWLLNLEPWRDQADERFSMDGEVD